MAVFGLWQLSSAESLAVAERSASAERVIQQHLSDALAAGQPETLQGSIRQLVSRPDLGLVYVSVADAKGEVIAYAGRYEQWVIPGLPEALIRSLRLWAYRWTGRFQEVPLQVQTDVDGAPMSAEAHFVIAPGVAGEVNDKAVLHLAWSGVIAFLLAAITGIGSIFTWRRFVINPLQWAERLAPEIKPSGLSGVELDERFHDQMPQRLGPLLDQFERGLIVVDAQAGVRYLNETAAQLTGWNAADVGGRLVYSVFHPLDSRYSPMLTPAEVCMRDDRPYPATELRLRARDGTQCAIEVMAQPLRRPNGTADGAMMVFHDISDREKRLDQWRRQARISQSVVDHLTEGVLTTDPAGVIRFANARALRMFGYAWEDLDGVAVSKLMPVPFLNSPSVRLTDYIGSELKVGLPKVAGWRRDVTTFPVELVVQNMTIDHAQGLLVIVRDITERLRSDNLSQRLGRLLDAASDEVYIFDAQTLRFVEINRGARRNLGYHASEMTHMTPLVISEQLDATTFRGYLDSLRNGDTEHVTYRCQHRRADGSRYPVEVRLNFSREEDPPVFMAIAVDITEREEAEQRLEYLAHYDALTGLPNRLTLQDRLTQAILAARRSHRQLGVLYLDVDHFKQFNDSYGHEVGDTVLRLVAERLSGLLRASDTVARLGGDEFVIVAPGLRVEEDAAALGRKIVEAFRKPMQVREHRLDVTMSVGVALCPADEGDADTLLRHADEAMYRSKQAGRARCTVHQVELSPERRRQIDLDRDVQSAMTLGQFDLRWVPVVAADAPDRALSRLATFDWRHPQYGLIDAQETILHASRSGFVTEIELWRLRAAAEALVAIGDEGDLIVPIAGWHWQHAELGARVLDIATRVGLLPQRLLIASDTAGFREARAQAQDNLYRVCSAGFRLALADGLRKLVEALLRGGLPPLAVLLLDAAELSTIASDEEVGEQLEDLRRLAVEQGLELRVVGALDATALRRLRPLAAAR